MSNTTQSREEILLKALGKPYFKEEYPHSFKNMLLAMQQAQEAAVDEALKMAAENASIEDISKTGSYFPHYVVDQDSIFSLRSQILTNLSNE